MNRSARWLGVSALAVLLALSTGCSKLKARDQLNKGVQSYKAAKFEDAIEHFKNAVALDPNLGVARLYLATAYVGLYVPGIDTPENNRNAEMALEQYQEVLKKKPNDTLSLKGIASLYFNMKKFEEAKQYHHKVLQVDPSDPETYYTIGVIDWSEAYQPRMEARNKLGLKPDEPLKDKKECDDLRTKNQDIVQDGIEKLRKAIELRQDYGDAMAYLNLMYREKADIECGDEVARAEDLKQADDYVEKAKAAMKAKAEKEANKAAGVVAEPGQQ